MVRDDYANLLGLYQSPRIAANMIWSRCAYPTAGAASEEIKYAAELVSTIFSKTAQAAEPGAKAVHIWRSSYR